jgi:outer membrane protein TolC
MSRRVRLLAGLWICLASASVQTAQGATTLTDFLRSYLAADSDLEAASMRADAAAATMRVKAYVPYPSVRMDLTSPYYSWQRSYTYQYYLDRLYRGYLESEDRSYRLGLTLTQRLPTGGDLSITGTAHRDRAHYSYGGFPPEIPIELETADRQFLTDVGISFDQPLLGIWDRKDEVRMAKFQYRRDAADYMLSAAARTKAGVDAFFDYLVAVERAEIEGRRLELARANASAAQERSDAGLVTEVEVIDARLEVTSREMDHREALASLEKAKVALRVIVPSGASDLVPEDLTQEFQLALSGFSPDAVPEVAKAKWTTEIARLSLGETERRRFGQTTVSFWYGLQGLGDDLAAAREEFDRNRWGGSLSIGFTLPEPGLRSDIDLARANVGSAEAAYQAALADAVARHNLAAGRMESLRATLALQARRADLLEDLVEIRRDQLDQQVISKKDLVQAEIDMLTARVDLYETMRALGAAWIDMAAICGENPAEIIGIKN